MCLQLDGAPADFSANVREHITHEFGNRWIGRLGPIGWPPDLTPLDFFLWGNVKSEVYRIVPTTRENMVERIHESFRCITPSTLRAVRRNFARRVHLCLEQNGRHFEQFL